MSGIPIHVTEVDGVPCFWAEAPGPPTAGLLFRAGLVDEQLAASGITTRALVGREHHVGPAITSLYGDRPEDEKTTLDRMLMMRFGARGPGLSFYEPFGHRREAPERVQEWSERFFTRGNAALWMTYPPPADMSLGLPDGPRVPPPEPRPIPALMLPAYAAAGDGETASSLLAGRGAAVTAAGRTVAARIGSDTSTWQFPLTANVSHRFLSTNADPDAVAAAFAAVAADGPTREELDAAVAAITANLIDDDAVAALLERMAVDELLGAPRRTRDDLAAEAQALSYAEVAAALREALPTQILLGPADHPEPPDPRFHPFPWFSRDQVQGSTLRAVQRGSNVRLVVSQEGVSHVGDGGQVSTVRFPEVAAAVQEPDGALTLIADDGAIVPIDPHAFKGAGQLVSDLERRLPPDRIVPPSDTGRLEQLARRKLRPGAPVAAELQLLREQVGQEEGAVNLCETVVGMKHGLLVLTERRVLWVSQGPTAPVVRELPYRDVTGVKHSRVPSTMVTLRSPAGEIAFSQITPKERAGEIAEEIERRAAAAQYEMNSQSDPSGSRK